MNTQTTQTHSPLLPLSISIEKGTYGAGVPTLRDGSGNTLFPQSFLPLVVKAVNNHQGLIDALSDLVEFSTNPPVAVGNKREDLLNRCRELLKEVQP